MGNCDSKSSVKSTYNQRSSTQNGNQEEISISGPLLHQGPVLSVATVNSDNFLSCSDDKNIALHSLTRMIERKFDYNPVYFSGHLKAVNIVRRFDESRFISASRDLSIKMWDCRDPEGPLFTLPDAHSLNITALASDHKVDSTDLTIFSGSRDYSVKRWDVEKSIAVSTFSAPRNIVTCMQYNREHHPDLLFQGSEDLSIRVWDIRSSGSTPAQQLTGYVYFPLCMSIYASNRETPSKSDGNLLVTGSKGFNSVGCTLTWWDLRATSKPLHEITGHSQDITDCQFIYNIDSQNDYLVTCCKDGNVKIWNSSTFECIGSYQYTNKCLSSLTVLPNNNNPTNGKTTTVRVVVAGFDGTINILKISFPKDNSTGVRIEEEYSSEQLPE